MCGTILACTKAAPPSCRWWPGRCGLTLEFREAVRATLVAALWRNDWQNIVSVRQGVRYVFGDVLPLENACRFGLVRVRKQGGEVVGYEPSLSGDFVLARQFPGYVRTLPQDRVEWCQAIDCGPSNGRVRQFEGGEYNHVFFFLPGSESFDDFKARVIREVVKDCGSQKVAARVLGVSERVVCYWATQKRNEKGGKS